MARVRTFLAALGHDELSGAARTVIAAIVVFVPFGSIVLLARWSPIRRLLRKLDPHARVVDVEGEVPPAPGEAVLPDEREAHEVPPAR